jgi:hypothetical protein
MFDESNINRKYPVFIFGFSSLNKAVERHYENTEHKAVLREVVNCKRFQMQLNFCVTSRVLIALHQAYPEKDAIINCIKGMLHEDNPSTLLSPIASTVRLAQLKQFEDLDVVMVTEDETEKGQCKTLQIKAVSPSEAVKLVKKIVEECLKL